MFDYAEQSGWTMREREFEVSFPRWVFGGDVEPDGRLDLVVVSQIDRRLTVFLDALGRTPRRVEYELPGKPLSVAAANVDELPGDEILVSIKLPATVRVYSLDRSGRFSEKASLDPTPDLGPGASVEDLVVADMDGDKYPDIVAANFYRFVQVFHGGGEGSFKRFEQVPIGAIPRWIAVTDVNLDGRADVIVATRGIGALGRDEVIALIHDTSGGFLPAEPIARVHDPVAIETADLDDDQRPDILVLNRALNSVQIFLNRTAFPDKSSTCVPGWANY